MENPQKIRQVAAENFGKVPPQATDMEEYVLGALMIQSEAFANVSQLLKPEMFYREAHKNIFTAILELSSASQPVDIYTVCDKMQRNQTLEISGGVPYITELTTRVASAAHIEYHAKIIAQKYLSRELIRISSEIQKEAFDDSTDVDDLMQKAEGMIFEISQKNIKKDYQHINPIIEEARMRISKAGNQQNNGISGIPTDFRELDKITAGWQPSDLIIIAARPAMGKTAFVLSMAKNIAVNFQIPVAFFSLEMSNVQLVNRLITNVCSITGEKLKTGQLEQEEWLRLDNRIVNLIDAPIYIDDTPSLSVLELRSKARRLVQDHGVKIIIIDYLQLMNATGIKFNSREQEVSIISRSLKGLAKELDIPIIALSQLNRNVENRGGEKDVDGKQPQLSDLRESGAIEQDADIVCFIHRPEYYKILEDSQGKDMRGVAKFIVAKHRNGSTDTINLKFVKEFTRFTNDDSSDEYAPAEENYVTLSSRANRPADEGFAAPPPPDSSVPF